MVVLFNISREIREVIPFSKEFESECNGFKPAH